MVKSTVLLSASAFTSAKVVVVGSETLAPVCGMIGGISYVSQATSTGKKANAHPIF